jgi:hypothetical protein
MIGTKKLSTIREELRKALAKEKSNPIPALDRKLRRLGKKAKSRSLVLMRGALAQLVKDQPQKPRQRRMKRTTKAT